MFWKRREIVDLISIFLLLLLLLCGRAGAEDLSIWPHRMAVAVGNASTDETQATREITNGIYKVTSLDTAALIAQGLMRSDCGDIRVADSNGSPFAFMISGCNSTGTQVYFEIPQVPSNTSMSVYLHYGNLEAASPGTLYLSGQTTPIGSVGTFRSNWRSCAQPYNCYNSDPTAGTTGNLVDIYDYGILRNGGYTYQAKKLFHALAGSYQITFNRYYGTDIILSVFDPLTGAVLTEAELPVGNENVMTLNIPRGGPTVWVYRVWGGEYAHLTDVSNLSSLSSISDVNVTVLPATILRPYNETPSGFTSNWKTTESCIDWFSSCGPVIDNLLSDYQSDESSLAAGNVNSFTTCWGSSTGGCLTGYRKRFHLAQGNYEYCIASQSTDHSLDTKIFDDAGNILHNNSIAHLPEGTTRCYTFTVPTDTTVSWMVKRYDQNRDNVGLLFSSFNKVGVPGPADLPHVSSFSCPAETYPEVSNSCSVEGSTVDDAPLHYKWIVDSGDPGVITGSSANVRFVTPGTKTVKVKMWRDDLGETYASYTTTSVNVRNPVIGLTVDCPQSALVNEEIVCTTNLSAVSGITYNYFWQTTGQVTQNNTTNIKVKFTSTGEKITTVRVEQAGYPGVSMSVSAATKVTMDFSMSEITCPSLLRMGEAGQCSVNASTTTGTLVYRWSATGSGVHFGSPSGPASSIYFTQGGIKGVQVVASLQEYPEVVKTAYAMIDVSPVHVLLDTVTCPASVSRLQPFTCDVNAFWNYYTVRLDMWNYAVAYCNFSWSMSPGGVVQEATERPVTTVFRDIPGEGVVEGMERNGQATMVFLDTGPKTVTVRGYMHLTPAIYVERTMDVMVTMPPPTVSSANCGDVMLGQKAHCSMEALAIDGTLRYMWAAQGGMVEDEASPNTGILFRTAGPKTVTAAVYLEEDPSVAVNTPIVVNVKDNPLEVRVYCPESAATGDTFTCTAEASAAWGTPVLTWNMDNGIATSSGTMGYLKTKKEGAMPVRVTMSLAEADWLTKSASALVKVVGTDEITPRIIGPKGVYVRTENIYEAQAPCIAEGSCTVKWRVGEIEHEGRVFAVTFPTEGKYTLRAEARFAGSALAKATELVVHVQQLPQPIVTIKGPGAVFVGQPATFRIEVAEKHKGLGVIGRWVLPDGSVAEGTEASITPASGGYQELTYEAWIEGEKETTTRVTKKRINCVAYAFPLPKIGLKSLEGLAPYRVTFKTLDTVKRVPGAEYRIIYDWDFGDGETLNTNNTIVGHTFVRSGTYNVTMTATDHHGNVSRDSKTVTAGAPPVEISLKVSSSNKAVRAPVDIYVRNTITKRSTLDRLESHEWAIDDALVEETQPGWMKTTFTEPGTHTITYTATMKSGAIGKQSTTITVNPNQPPVCDIEYKDNAASRYVYLKAKCTDPDGRMSGYKWDLDDGRGLRNGSVNISFKAPEAKTYNVTLVGIDDAGGACEFVEAIPITR